MPVKRDTNRIRANIPGISLLFSFFLLYFWGLMLQGVPGAMAENGRDFEEWLRNFKKEVALEEGISEKTLKSALAGIEYNSRVIELDRNQPEFELTLSQYLERTVSQARIKKGRQKLAANRSLLKKIKKQYGVAPRYLVALWGMESRYCSQTGNFPVLEALATLTYDPRRSLFFRKELLAALHLLDSGAIKPTELKGSWAGALGCLQFLPSVFRKYGVDYDKDGRLEIYKAGGDLFASAAFYLKDSGWLPGRSWGAEVLIPEKSKKELLPGRVPQRISFWLNHGVKFKKNKKEPEEDLKAALIQPDKQEERYFLAFGNFNVLLKWNRSDYYAIATGLLADQIKEEPSEPY